MAAFVKTAIPNRFVGSSTDTKPTGVGVGSMCYEHNTGKTFVTYDGTNWVQYAPAVYLGDVVPLADDTSYLGTNALGWKGLYLPDTLIVDDTGVVKIRNVANDADLSLTALNLTLSGTTTALTFSGAATIVAGSGLTIPAFTLGGKLTAGSSEIEGSAFDINGGTIASVTLDGSIAGGDQSWTNVGDMTFAAGSILASGSTNGNTLLIKANDTTLMTLTTGATDTLDIGAHNISGDSTVTATKLLTFGNVGTTICDTYVQFSDGSGTAGPKLKYGAAATYIVVRNAADSGDANLQVSTLAAGYVNGATFTATGAATAFSSKNTDTNYLVLQSRDSGVGLVEIARMAGAADPYFRVGRDDTGVALNAVTDGLYLMMAGGTGNSSAGQGFGMPFYLGNAASETEERASIDCVLVTATNGAEDARFDFNCQTAGAAPATKFSCGAGGIGFFAKTPVTQQAHIADASGDDATAVNAIIDALKAYGLLAPDP
jgi:hypothetical protein